ncbi:MAG: glycosyltransferase family 2 protein [Treponema sp.]|jgi:GT2 family glycosyltransferase|nr:glycosyltransferase family 2 protein [Treponema sp.]
MNISIIIVNYNTKDLLRNCLDSIYRHSRDIGFEVIVSDNGSLDGSVEMIKESFPGVKIIENRKNIGFGAANNRGLDSASGNYVFYLNSDTVLLNNAIKFFFEFWENYHDRDHLGALGCVLLNSRGLPTHSWGGFSSATRELREKLPGARRSRPAPVVPPLEVDYIAGAALFLKNDGFARFDERFFLYFEDSDLQLRLAGAGKKRIIIDKPRIIHLEGASNSPSAMPAFEGSFSRIQFAISKIKYYRKKKDNPLCIFILKMLILVKWLNPLLLRNTSKYFKQLLLA